MATTDYSYNNRQARAALDVFRDLDVKDTILELDSMSPEEHKELAKALRMFFGEPANLTTEQVIARHKLRLSYLIN